MLKKDILEIGQFIPLHYHFQMLSDNARMAAFKSAIEQIVTPQHKVAELGSGTGVLSYFAAKQGAQVWSVEYNPAMVSASRKFIHENKMTDKVQIFEGDAAHWLPPEPVDVVICEMLHSALLREKQLEVVSAFRDAHLARFGTAPRLLPNATLLGVQPVWQCYDFNGYYAPVPLFQSAYANAEDCIPCGDPSVYKIIDYDNAILETFESTVSFTFEKDTYVNALRFITKSLLTMVDMNNVVDWHSQHLILPLREPLEIQAGKTLEISFSYRPGDPIEILSQAIVAEVKEDSLYVAV